MIAGTDKGVVKFWDANLGEESREFQIHQEGYFMDLVISPNGERVASLGTDGVKVWDFQTGQIDFELDAFGRLEFSPDGSRLVTSGENGDGTGKIKNLERREWGVTDKY